MYAVFGDILFEVLTSPTRLESVRGFDYAEHRVVQDRPRLQWLSDALETITLELMLHVAFTNPKTQLDALNAAAQDHLARALVFGNGVHRGYFVLTGISETRRHDADDGSLIWTTARIELKEYAFGATIDPFAPPQPTVPPPAIVAALSIASGSLALLSSTQPIGQNNLLPTAALLTLGALPTNTYFPPTYASAGISAGVSNPAASASASPGNLNYTTVPASVAVRQAP
jgi:phage protein U